MRSRRAGRLLKNRAKLSRRSTLAAKIPTQAYSYFETEATVLYKLNTRSLETNILQLFTGLKGTKKEDMDSASTTIMTDCHWLDQ